MSRKGIMLSDYPITHKMRARFWAKVPDRPEEGCWEWKASKGFRDYGKFRIGPTYMAAHRVAYYLAFGPFDESLLILHTCDNPSCVKPSHLDIGTQADNNLDKMKKGRHSYKTPWGRPGFHAEHRWRKDG